MKNRYFRAGAITVGSIGVIYGVGMFLSNLFTGHPWWAMVSLIVVGLNLDTIIIAWRKKK